MINHGAWCKFQGKLWQTTVSLWMLLGSLRSEPETLDPVSGDNVNIALCESCEGHQGFCNEE